MTETPREYKNRIDEQRRKRRRNRDELIECINEYELVDERYKAETKQEILASFEKNENAEKTWELYVKIWEELANIEQKYQELEELKENLEAKRNERETLKNELKGQNIDWDDKTTLKMQMQKIKSIKSKLENIEWEIENLENEIQNREREIEEIEEMYWKKEDSDETSIDEEENQEIKKKTVEKQKKESPKTLQEYKETILNERWRIDDTKQKILKLLEEWIWIDEILKEKIKWKISDVFEKYSAEVEWSLRMKSAKYMDYREAILELDTEYRIKVVNWKKCIMKWVEQCSDFYDDIPKFKEIWWKPCFEAIKAWKWCIMWWNEQCSDWFDFIWEPIEIWWKPCFKAQKDWKWCIMWGSEQQGDWFNIIRNLKEIWWKPYFRAEKHWKYCLMWWKEQQWDWLDDFWIAKKERRKFEEKFETEAPREEREKVILDRYQKKLNRDELLKIISWSDAIDEETKKKLKSEILSDFYTEFEKVTSTKEFQEFDKKYRELKKTGRKKTKKSAELEAQKGISKPEVEELDKKLFEIANSAMKLEDDSRLKIIKSKRLEKAKEEWNILESRLNEILEKVKGIHKEETELIWIYSEKEKKYWKKVERPEIKRKELRKDIVATEKLEAESTLLWHRNAYMELIKDKEKYIDELLKEIETTDFWISEEKKKDVIEKLKSALEKDLEIFKEWDEITKLANETEKWLKENWKSIMEQINELKWKIEVKEAEISKLKSKQIGDDSKEIYKNKERKFELKDELLDLKDQYKSIKTELEEKLKKYDGTIIDWTDQIHVETRDEKLEREEREREKIKIELKDYHEAWKEKLDLKQGIKELIIKAAEKFIVKIETDSEWSRLITIKFWNKKYKILDPILDNHSTTDEGYSYMVDDSDKLLSKSKRQVYSRWMIWDLDKRGNVPLRDYVKQKQNEWLHLAKIDEINGLLKAVWDMAGLEDTRSQIAMLMYLTGINWAYRAFSDEDQPNEWICFDKSLAIKQCSYSYRLNLLMINATE